MRLRLFFVGWLMLGAINAHAQAHAQTQTQTLQDRAAEQLAQAVKPILQAVPMSTLMRRAAEECDSLEEVRQLWTNSPRTCEYFYIVADGKVPDAISIYATSTQLNIVKPGQSHAMNGAGIGQCVLMSKDDRLEALRGLIRQGHGKIDEAAALRMMKRPVARQDNLHSVLFIPGELRFHVAVATRDRRAFEVESVECDLRELLQRMPAE
jgi:hypothetical protein